MSSFHDQIFSEIDAARKLAAGFASRHGRSAPTPSHVPSAADRVAQEEAAAAEIAALAAEEERLANQARERAEHRAKARAEETAKGVEVLEVMPEIEQSESRWNAVAILEALAKLRAKERLAAEELIRQAHEVRDDESAGATDHPPVGQEPVAETPADPVRGTWTPSLGANQIWYFTSGGTRCGPVTFAELRTMAASRVLDPRLDMVWKEGLEAWKPAGLLDGLFERRSAPAEAPESRGGQKSRLITALPTDLTAALATKHLSWPGIGRLPLWLGLLVFPLVWSHLLGWGTPTLNATFGSELIFKMLPFSSIVPIGVLIYLVMSRLVNLGMSRGWAVVLAIPVLNLWVAFRCLVCPSGYAHHRKLDRSGKVIALAAMAAVPAGGYVYLKHPGWFSPAQVQPAVHRLIERAGKTVSPR